MRFKPNRFSLRPGGFTLIEVLVVVAIIALLISIMIPSLVAARKQAKAVVCQCQLSEWGKIWAMYCQSQKDSFSAGRLEDGGTWQRGEWITSLRSLYYTKTDILRCPVATQRIPGAEHGGPFNTYAMEIGNSGGTVRAEECSYGINNWVSNPPAKYISIQGRPTSYNWRRTSGAKFPNRVPVFADTMWRGGGPDDHGGDGQPPNYDGEWTSAGAEMRHFCINRHEGYNNHLFMDWSVRKVGIKELWKLKWHRYFNTSNQWTRAGGVQTSTWPMWMRRFPNY